MYSVWRFFIQKRSFSFLLLIALVLFGSFAALSIPKESAPEVQVPIGIVTTILPGASALDVERLVTNKLEDRLQNNLTDLKSLTSSSRAGVSSVVAEFEASADLDKSIQELKDEVDTIVPELPQEAEDPFVSEVNFADQPIVTISITSDVPAERLLSIAQIVESEIESVNGVSRVEISGKRDRETQVVVKKEALSTFGLSLTDVVNGIRANNSNLPVGNIELDGINYNIAFEGDISSPSEIANIAITTSGGEPVYVRDIAFVSDGFEETTTFSRVSLLGEPSLPAITFSVFKRSGGDITVIAREVRTTLAQLQEQGGALEGVETLIFLDSGELVEEDLFNLTSSGLQTVGLVMIILFIMLGWREALLAGLAIPLSFLIAFIGLDASGNTINFVSLFSLILAVGILVDSAIVMVEGIHVRMKQYMGKVDAALETIREYHWPLTSGTMTTIAVFAPLFLISGITGEFIATIPFTIIFVLVASLVVALGIIPLLASKFLKRQSESNLEQQQEERANKLREWYKRNVVSILGHKKRENLFIALIIVLFFFTASFPAIGFVKVIFFSQEDADYLFVDVELPQGSTLQSTDFEARKVEEILYTEPRIESFLTVVGAGSPFSEGRTDSKFANMQITLRDDRNEGSSAILEEIRTKTETITTSEVRVFQPNSGPPTGDPIAIKLLGEDFEALNNAALIAEDALSSIPGTLDVITSTKDDGTEFVLSIDRAKASELGLNPAVIAGILRTAVEGSTATTIKQEDDIDVVVKLNLNANFRTPHDTNVTNLDAIRNIELITPGGTTLLGSVLETSIRKSNSVISHEDQKRVVTVSSQITPDANALEIFALFEERIADIELPEGVEVVIGGENEDVEQSFKDMGVALIIGMILMLSVLVLQFNSYRFALYVLMIVPFSLIGIFTGLAITGKPLSFPSIMGFIALSGIVVNNSILLIDVMNKLRRRHPEMSIQEVVTEGAAMRLRPILLTTITTVVGISPLIFASELWGPLAYSIMFGLAFSIVITLILIPIVYRRWPGNVS